MPVGQGQPQAFGGYVFVQPRGHREGFCRAHGLAPRQAQSAYIHTDRAICVAIIFALSQLGEARDIWIFTLVPTQQVGAQRRLKGTGSHLIVLTGSVTGTPMGAQMTNGLGKVIDHRLQAITHRLVEAKPLEGLPPLLDIQLHRGCGHA